MKGTPKKNSSQRTPQNVSHGGAWTQDEVRILTKGYEKYGHHKNCMTILLQKYKFHPKRTSGDLRDKLRELGISRKNSDKKVEKVSSLDKAKKIYSKLYGGAKVPPGFSKNERWIWEKINNKADESTSNEESETESEEEKQESEDEEEESEEKQKSEEEKEESEEEESENEEEESEEEVKTGTPKIRGRRIRFTTAEEKCILKGVKKYKDDDVIPWARILKKYVNLSPLYLVNLELLRSLHSHFYLS